MMDEALYEQNPNNFTPAMDVETEEYLSQIKNRRNTIISYLHRYELNENYQRRQSD